jgi:transcriptional regulator with XRE-family HTH domain
MANENLKHALQRAGLTVEEIADIIKVDPKTVQRWAAGRTPYPRHRATIARALDLSEHELWPDAVPRPSADSARREGAVGESEVTGTWAYATGEGAPDPIAFISNADGPIDLLDNGRGIALTDGLLGAIAEPASAGRHVRLLTSLPKPRLEPLIRKDDIEIRVIDAPTEHSLLRVGDTMLLTFNLADEGDQPSPLLKLQRATDDGLFDRLADNLDTLWDDADETLTDLQQLDAYLTNTDEDEDDEAGDWADPTEPNALATAEPPHPASHDETPTPTETEQTQRRWPRRPN